MALSDAEVLVYAKSDDVISDIVRILIKELQRDYGVFTSRIYGGAFIALTGLALIVISMTFLNIPILLYAGIAVIVFSGLLVASAFMIKTRIETASLKLYPILFAGFGHGEFFAIDPFGNGEDISLPYYNLDDVSKAMDKLADLQAIMDQFFRGEVEPVFRELRIGQKTVILAKPLIDLYQVYTDLIDTVKSIGVETRTYNMVFPEENDVPMEIKIPIEKSGFSEDIAIKKLDIEEIDKLYQELIDIHRNWEEIVDRLKALREKLESQHGQITAHFEWLRRNYADLLVKTMHRIPGLFTYICPNDVLAKNYYSDPLYPSLGLITVKENGEVRRYYQCSICGYRLETDDLLFPVDGINRSIVDDIFNEAWLKIYEGNRDYMRIQVGNTRNDKETIINNLYEKLSKNTVELTEKLDEFMKRIDRSIMDVKLYTEMLERIGLEGVTEIYKAIYENADYMKKILKESPTLIKDALADLLKIRIDPEILNKGYLEVRKKSAETIGREDVKVLIDGTIHGLEHDKIFELYTPLIKIEEEKTEEEKEEREGG